MNTNRPTKWEHDQCSVYEREMMYQAARSADKGSTWGVEIALWVGAIWMLLRLGSIRTALDDIVQALVGAG